MFGVQRYREEPVYGTTEVPFADPAAGPVPYRHLLAYSTEQLWRWWRSIKVMPPTDPDMDQILREVQAKRQGAEAAEQLYQEQLAWWTRLRDAFQVAAGFCMQDYAVELGREPTRDEFYRAWAERLATLGRTIRELGMVDWVEREYHPDSLDGRWTRGMILRASKMPDDVAGLQELLKQSGAEAELHAVRHRLRDVGDQLLKETSPAMTTNEDSDSLDRDLAALREECRSRRLALDVWNVTRHGNQNFPEDCVRDLWQKVRGVAYRTARKAPPREPDKVPDVPAAQRALDEVVRWCEEQENGGETARANRSAVESASHMAGLSLAQNQAVAGLADLFVDFDFLPNSGASYTWREAATENGLGNYWQKGSKRPVIVRLLESALQHQPGSFCCLVLTAVRRGIRRRQGKSPQTYPPITREAITAVNRLLRVAGFDVPEELNDPAFLASLPAGEGNAQQQDHVAQASGERGSSTPPNSPEGEAPSSACPLDNQPQGKPDAGRDSSPMPAGALDFGQPKPVEVFFSYSHRDEEFRGELEKHLTMLKRQGWISGWHDRKITAGTEWEGQIDAHLNAAGVILLLVSVDFLASHYCYDIELKRAMERHEAGHARVIPIILRPCDWKAAPFGKLQALPKDARPVTEWRSRDKAFTDVALGIRAAVEELRQAP
jgi:hypothetical protein